MGGCTNCAAKTGCNDRKGEMFAALDETLARLYPSRTWGEPDDLARFEAGIPEDDGQALAEELAAALDASTFFRPGGPDEYCDYIYVLCVGREPCLVQLRDGEVAVPAEIGAGEGMIREQYLRVCLSQMARMAGVQQVAMALDRLDDGFLIREEPRAGVYDAPLLPRFQRLVALLPGYDIVHLDFGEISAPPAGFAPGDYARLYGGAPDTANYLFYPQPATMKQACFVPA
ncbi:hypothetical protein [Haliangium sp.]|uniref:hypothetical protein n=1 Tax=Haliangium sp. TaxID=2663208 RepID=UPI003D141F37